MTINGGPSAPETKTLPRHKKNPEVGEKQTVYTSTILLEQEDAASFEDQEEVCHTITNSVKETSLAFNRIRSH